MAMYAFALHKNREKFTDEMVSPIYNTEVLKPVQYAGHPLRNSHKLMVVLQDRSNMNN